MLGDEILRIAACLALLSYGCSQAEQPDAMHEAEEGQELENATDATVVFHAEDAAFGEIFGDNPDIEIIHSGLTWAEGPVWLEEEGGFLLFTDVPENRLYKWSRKNGVEVFLEPSGAASQPSIFREPGANGLARDAEAGFILVANHGRRAVTRLNLQTKESEDLVGRYNDRALNSPNDLVRTSEGVVYFTDPPYGLKDLDESPVKEQAMNGVYRFGTDGELTLVTGQFSRPNGIALSPEEKTLYVANSDPSEPVIIAFPIDDTGVDVENGKLIHNGSTDLAHGALGLPDGMVVDAAGRIFATVPGGVHVFEKDGSLIGIIDTGTANSNCTIGEDGTALFIAAHWRIIRIGINAATPTESTKN